MNAWGLAWRLARRELHARFRGLRLLLVCLFLGVGALAAIGSLTQAIGGELAARGRTILGGDVEFAVSQRGANAEERAAMARLGALSETVRMQSMAIRDTAAGPRTVPVELKAVDGAYPLYGALKLAGGATARAPPEDRVWVAQALVDRLGVRTGDRLRFGNATFTVGGVIADEPDRLGEGFTLGPVAILSTAGMARTGLIQPGSLYETKIRVRMAGGDPGEAADAIKAAFPSAGWETRTRDRAAPGASRFIDRMGQFLTLVGLAALIIAGIGVGNGVAAYLAARRGSIATLKVLGATSGLIARVYLLQIMTVAGVGIAAGLAVGIAAVPAIVWAAGDVLPVAPTFTVHPLPLALAAAYGLLIALAFAAPPLVAAGEIPAAGLLRGLLDQRRAPLRKVVPWMATAGIGLVGLVVITSREPLFSAGFIAAAAGMLLLLAGFGWLVRRVALGAPRPRRPLLRLAIAAIHRPGARTGTLVVALGLGLTLFVLLAAIRTSLDANIARSVPARAPALFALDVPRDREQDFRAVIARTEPQSTVRTVPALRGTITGYAGTRVADLEEIPDGAWALRGERGLTYAAELPPGSTVVEGRWWSPDYTGPPLVSIDQELADILDLNIGDPITYAVLGVEQQATIASFRRIDWDTMGFNFIMVFSPNAIADVPHNLAATVDLPKGREPAVMQALLPRFPSVSLIEVGGVIGQVRDIVAQMAAAIAAAASIAILAGIAVLIGAITAARETRTYDSVILKTLGATRAQILGAQAIEYALLSVVLAGVAFALGMGGAWYVMTQIFEFDWLPDYAVVLATLAGGAGLTMTIGLLGALPILAARPAQALREL